MTLGQLHTRLLALKADLKIYRPRGLGESWEVFLTDEAGKELARVAHPRLDRSIEMAVETAERRLRA